MDREHLRCALLNGIAVIFAGMMTAGLALTAVVMRDVYHMAIAEGMPGDYRGWLMAHLEGLLNGLLVMAMAGAATLRPLPARRSRVLMWSLIVMGWGNFIGALLAPVFSVRGMAYNGDIANDVVTGIFSVAFIGTLISFYILIRALSGAGRLAGPSLAANAD